MGKQKLERTLAMMPAVRAVCRRLNPDAVPPFRAPRPGADGVARCRWCWGPIREKRRRSWCSAACVDEYNSAFNWNVSRRMVYERDGGRCQLCGRNAAFLADVEHAYDMLAIRADSMASRLHDDRGQNGAEYHAAVDLWSRARALKKIASRLGKWEADHVVARRDGGIDHPTNLRVLCRACHVARTADQRRGWARASRGASGGGKSARRA